jgi:hypothetical protein
MVESISSMPDLENIPAYLRDVANRTAEELWKVARQETTSARLVLPNYRGGKRRVSEQEARSIAQRLVADGEYFFSIETPTDGLYNFTGREGHRGRSAQHDMSLYLSADPVSVAAHIEFKQGHKSGDDGIQVIAKDLEKLIGSMRHSLWFHSFALPRKNEFEKLRRVFLSAIDRVLSRRIPSADAQVVLAFCAVVEPVAWIAGPAPWVDVRHMIDQFPVAGSSVHASWVRSTPTESLSPPRDELEFEDDADGERP